MTNDVAIRHFRLAEIHLHDYARLLPYDGYVKWVIAIQKQHYLDAAYKLDRSV